jgi:uncharacterized Fe-S center protein
MSAFALFIILFAREMRSWLKREDRSQANGQAGLSPRCIEHGEKLASLITWMESQEARYAEILQRIAELTKAVIDQKKRG